MVNVEMVMASTPTYIFMQMGNCGEVSQILRAPNFKVAKLLIMMGTIFLVRKKATCM